MNYFTKHVRDVASIIDDKFKEELRDAANKIVPKKVKINTREKTVKKYTKKIDQKKQEFLEVMKNRSPIEIKDKPKECTIAYFQCQECEFSSLVPLDELKGNVYQPLCELFYSLKKIVVGIVKDWVLTGCDPPLTAKVKSTSN